MPDQRLTDEDVDRVSSKVAKKLLRYVGVGLLVWFLVLPLIGFALLYVYRSAGP